MCFFLPSLEGRPRCTGLLPFDSAFLPEVPLSANAQPTQGAHYMPDDYTDAVMNCLHTVRKCVEAQQRVTLVIIDRRSNYNRQPPNEQAIAAALLRMPTQVHIAAASGHFSLQAPRDIDTLIREFHI